MVERANICSKLDECEVLRLHLIRTVRCLDIIKLEFLDHEQYYVV